MSNQTKNGPEVRIISISEKPKPVSATRVSATFVTIAALALTPLRPELMPLTPQQQLEALLASSICGSGQMPDRESLCHAPKVTLRPRREDPFAKHNRELL